MVKVAVDQKEVIEEIGACALAFANLLRWGVRAHVPAISEARVAPDFLDCSRSLDSVYRKTECSVKT
jgi:hypothetical protein